MKSTASIATFFAAFLTGLIPQSGDHPLMLVPLLLMICFLMLSNGLSRLSARDPLLLILLLLWLAQGVSGLFSPVPFPSKVTWLIFAALPVSYIFASVNKSGLFAILIGTGLALSATTFWAFFHGAERPDAPFNDANLLGIFLSFSALAALAHRRTRFLFAVCAAAMVVTESRTAFLAILAGLGIFFFLPKSAYEQNLRTFFPVIAATFLTMLAAIFISGFDQRMLATFHESAGRLAIWQGAWQMAWIKPLTGLGAGTFHLHYPPFRLAGDDSAGQMVHLEPLQMAVESGWLAVILLYAAFGWAARQTILLHRNNLLQTDHIIAASLLMALFVAMHLTYPLHVLPFLMLMGCCLAILQPRTGHENQIFSFSILLTFLGSIWLLITSIYTFLIWDEVQKSAHLHDQPRFDAAIKECIGHADPDFPDCRIMAARFLSLIPYPDKERIEKLLDDADLVFPLNPEIPLLRGQIAENTQLKLKFLERSLERNPMFWPARRSIIQIDLERKDFASAKKHLEPALIYPYPEAVRKDIETIGKQIDDASHQIDYRPAW